MGGFEIHFKHLIDLTADGRQIEQGFHVGSIQPSRNGRRIRRSLPLALSIDNMLHANYFKPV
jgi:hypothetical protein